MPSLVATCIRHDKYAQSRIAQASFRRWSKQRLCGFHQGRTGQSSSATSNPEVSGNVVQTQSWSFLLWYDSMLKKYPLTTKALTCGIIAGGGDVTCQMFLEGNDPAYDPARTTRFAILGTVFVAPANHIWFRYLAKEVAPGQTWRSAITCTVLDQFTWTPILTVIWLSSLWKMEGSGNRDIVEALERDYMDIMKANWLVWIPAQLLNFKVVRLKYQVLFTNVVELFWNAYLSFAATGRGDEGSE